VNKNKKKKVEPKCTDPAFDPTHGGIIEVVGENQFIVRFDRLLAPYRKKKLPAAP